MAAAQDSVEQAVGSLILAAAGTGMAVDLAAMFREDPLKAEIAFRDRFRDLACSILRNAFERIDDQGVSLHVGGEAYRKVEASTGRAMTLFGPVEYNRSRYQPSGGGAALFPTESVLGLTECGLTPAAAGLSLVFMSHLTARESEDAWERLCGRGPSASSLVRMASEAGRRFEARSRQLMAELRAEEEIHKDAVALLVSLDGVMVRMHAETGDGQEVEAGWREVSTGVVAMLDAEGNMVQVRYFGRLPEPGKASLKSQVSQEVFHCLGRREDLKVVAIADAAKDNWTFHDTFCPDVMLIDFWHSAQHLKVAADAAFGPDDAAGTAWFEKWRHILRHDPKGDGKVIDALRHLMRKETGRADIARELAIFRNNRKRMHYRHVADAGDPIGSGAVGSGNRMLVTQRLKRSGQRSGRDGGQGVLTFRALLKSGRLDRAWSMLAMSWQPWKPPTTANDNRNLELAA
ncbi:MAG: hypothetical protein OXI81_16280 [Paracoccaceae bacterium]|nr:hypothetical protein [Paracoccaceae bacterium]MDE2913115.1 hypothetical protein [Paracoccaceae bacterium]